MREDGDAMGNDTGSGQGLQAIVVTSGCRRLTSTPAISSFASTFEGVAVASIRDLVGAIRQRAGVEAAIILGRDGLLIDSQVVPGLDAEDLAARIPPIIGAADDLGAASGRGDLITTVLEHRKGLAIVSVLTSEAVLFVLLQPTANIGALIFELRRNREHIAALV
jgi:predicted regulator of Ras-like GTPase activity (Roadblock/LC7/MglB family)